MDLTAAYMAAAIVNKQQDSKPTVGKQDKTNPTGEVFNNRILQPEIIPMRKAQKQEHLEIILMQKEKLQKH